MATNFQLRVEKYFGDVCASEYMPSTTELSDILRAGGADIVNKIPAKLLEFMATKTAVTGTKKTVASVADNGSGQARLTSNAHGFANGDVITNEDFTDTAYNGTFIIYSVDTNTYDIYATYTATGTGTSYQSIGLANVTNSIIDVIRFSNANRKKYRCRVSAFRYIESFVDSDSFHYATVNDPLYFIEQSKIHVVPVPTDDDLCYLYSIVHPDITYDDTEATTDPPIASMPGGLIDLIVLYAVIQIYYRQKGYFESKFIDELQAITNSGYLTNFENVLPSYVDPANPSIAALSLIAMTPLPVLSLSNPTDAWSTFSETITLPALILSPMDSFPSEGMSGITVSSPGSLSMPTVPTLPSLVLAPMENLQAALSEADIDFSGITSPTYIKPIIGTDIGTLSLTETVLSISDSLDLPAGIVLPILELTSAPAFSNLVLPVAPVKTLSYTSAGDEPDDDISVSTSLPTFVMPVSLVSMSDFDTYMGSSRHDIELAQTDIRKQITLMNEFQANIQKEIGRFNGETSKYLAELQKETQTAQVDVSAYAAKMQDNKNDLDEQTAQYQGDIQKWQAEVNSLVQEWAQKEVQFKLAKWQLQVQSEISEYSNKVQALVSQYGSESSAKTQKYQTDIDKQLKNFQSSMTAEVNEWNTQKQADISKYSADIQESIQDYQSEIQHYVADVRKLVDQYVAESTSDVQKYQSNYQKLLEKFIRQNQINISGYQAVANTLLTKYANEIQDNIQEFNANVSYRIQEARFNLDREIQEYQLQTTTFINEYQAKTGVEIQSFSAEVNSVIQEYSAKVSSYSAKVQAYLGEMNALRNSELQEYSSIAQSYIQEYSGKNTALIGEFSANTQKEVQQYAVLVQGKVSEFQSVLSKARSYLEEAGVRLQTMAAYLQKSSSSIQDAMLLEKKYEKDINQFIGVNNG